MEDKEMLETNVNPHLMSDENAKKNGKTAVIIFVVAAVIILALIIGLIIYLINKDGQSSEANNGNDAVSTTIQEYLDSANDYMDRGKYEKAISAYEDAINEDKECEEAYLGIAEAYCALADEAIEDGDYSLAVSYYEDAVYILEKGLKKIDSSKMEKKLKKINGYIDDIENAGIAVDDVALEGALVATSDIDYRQQLIDEYGYGYSVGQIMPDFTVCDKDGNEILFSDIAGGRPTYINLFASWCFYCMEEMPDLSEFSKQYSNEMCFVFLDVGEGYDEAFSVASEFELDMSSVYYLNDWFIGDYELMYIPVSFVLNEYGQIVWIADGMAERDDMEGAISEALN